MSYRYDEFAPGETFHVFTRGVESRNIFTNYKDRDRFIKLMLHCLDPNNRESFSRAVKFKRQIKITKEGEGLVDIIGYCLMPNHFHLLLKENIKGGISSYMHKLLNSYAKYFNISQERTGSLFDHPFKAVLIVSDDQFLHVSRYIHLNPYVAGLTKNIFGYKWSSLQEYISNADENTCHTQLIESIMGQEEHKSFILDQAGYARALEDEKHLYIEEAF